MKPATALLCLNGDLAELPPLVEMNSYSSIVAVDGGLKTLLEAGIQPDTLIGDLDSVQPDALEQARTLGIEIFRIVEQETSDFEKALRHVVDAGFATVDVIGYRGSRFDHELATLAVAGRFADRIEIRLLDSEAEGYVITGPAEKKLANRAGQTCSILTVYPCKGAVLDGFKWPQAQVHVEGVPFSLSNEIVDDHASIKLQSGTLLIYLHGKTKA
ncbi:thiamine diphosphokinase [bacterium]|nr:thiamine diphosphokinase [bacterium]